MQEMRDVGLIPGPERSPGKGHNRLLQYSCLENFMYRGASWAAVHGDAKNQTWLKQLSTHAHAGEDTDEHLDKEMHRVRSAKVLRLRSFVLVESDCITLPVWTCQLGSSRNLVLFIGIFVEASSLKNDRSLTSCFLSPLENRVVGYGVGAENAKHLKQLSLFGAQPLSRSL